MYKKGWRGCPQIKPAPLCVAWRISPLFTFAWPPPAPLPLLLLRRRSSCGWAHAGLLRYLFTAARKKRTPPACMSVLKSFVTTLPPAQSPPPPLASRRRSGLRAACEPGVEPGAGAPAPAKIIAMARSRSRPMLLQDVVFFFDAACLFWSLTDAVLLRIL